MTKKIFILITFFIVLAGFSRVLAVNYNQELTTNEKILDNLIQIKVNENWQDEIITKYTCENEEMYKIGETKDESDGNKAVYYDARILRILKNNNLQNLDDKYMANQIAIDFVIKGNSLEEFENIYKVREDIVEESQNIRAIAILDEAKRLIDIGINGTEQYKESIEICKEGDFETDTANLSYTSQSFNIYARGAKVLWYEVTKLNEPMEYFIANYETGEEQEEFRKKDEKFKIMVPNELKEDAFNLEIKAQVHFLKEELIETNINNQRYIMLKEEEQVTECIKSFDNRFSSVHIFFEDKETKEMLSGGIIEFNGEEFLLNQATGINVGSLPKGELVIKIKKVPEGYLLEEDTYIANINYKEQNIANIGVLHEKGNLEITTNAKKAKYEIYNKRIGYIGTYEVLNGNLFVSLSTGDYYLKQIEVEDGYKLEEKEIDFKIEFNQLVNIKIMNEKMEQEKIPEKEQDTKPEKEPIKDETVKVPNINNTNVNIFIENIIQEVAKEEKIDIKQEVKDTSAIEKVPDEKIRKVLPRTGKDYFVFRIILVDLAIFLIFVVLGLIKKQTTKFKQSANSSIKE